MKPVQISVAMATYNGEPYLPQQLQSLVEQLHAPSELVVCDDGSTDGTLDVLKAFQERSPFPVRIYKNEHNLGFADNFLKAAHLCTGEWVAFCDQDDVWLPNRLLSAASAALEMPDTELILQNSLLCNGDLSERGRLFPDTVPPGFYSPNSLSGFWTWHGFLQTFRRSLLDRFKAAGRPSHHLAPDKRMSHDDWTCMIANSCGGIRVLAEPVALYRRHSGSITGPHTRPTWIERVDLARSTGQQHYLHCSNVAGDAAKYLNLTLSEWTTANSRHLRKSAEHFEILASIYKKRAAIYGTQSTITRMNYFADLVFTGQYIGRQPLSLGWKSMCKDALQVLGLRVTSKKRLPN